MHNMFQRNIITSTLIQPDFFYIDDWNDPAESSRPRYGTAVVAGNNLYVHPNALTELEKHNDL